MTESQTKQCQNCKTDFTIEPEDFAFYERVKVPPPTFCPQCRLQRRMSFRNEFTFYPRTCDRCSKHLISAYPAKTSFPVYCNDCWWSDKWDAGHYGRDLDFSKPFLEQARSLLETVPRVATFQQNCVGSDYVHYAFNSKNGYLVSGYVDSENCSYGNIVWQSKDSLDCFYVVKSELCYECINCNQCYRSSFLEDCTACNNSLFLANCRNCSDCIGCVNLIGKQYYIFNEPYSKEEYLEFRKKYEPLTHAKLLELQEKFAQLKLRSIYKYANLINTQHTAGHNARNSSHAKHVFYSHNLENSSFLYITSDTKEVYDMTNTPKPELCYECISGVGLYNCAFSSMISGASEIQYCDLCPGARNSFGCVGYQNAEYCILNKKYTKKEYEELVPKIIEHMKTMPYVDRGGRVYAYGEFFPVELSPFPYNDTQANDYFPLTQEQIIAKAYPYRDQEARSYKATLRSEDLPDSITEAKEDISTQIISCSCGKAYRFIQSEVQFYRQMGLPLPRACPNCRHKKRATKRAPLNLFHRACGCPEEGVYANTAEHTHSPRDCAAEFETPYAPDRPELIYCESCYNAEVA